MRVSGENAIQNASRNKFKRFPNEEDSRFDAGLLFPSLSPGFTLDSSAKVFTIGSCFARNIELVLKEHSIDLPTMAFSVGQDEWPFRPNGLLNQYNPATTSQRILAAAGEWSEPESTIIEVQDGFWDLSLPGGFPVSYERALARREEIDAVYEHLSTSDLVIITLGLVEAWLDHESNTYLNKMPNARAVRGNPGRYEFCRLSGLESFDLMDRAIESLVSSGVRRILLTVSPVPLGTTFTGEDVIVANSYSKSALRVCADELTKKHEEVDYFPSFEIVTSGGLAAFDEDNIHVRKDVVERVTNYMVKSYFPNI